MLSDLKDNQKGILSILLYTLIVPSMGIYIRYLNSSFFVLQQVYLRVFVAFLVGFIVFNKNLDFSKIKKISALEWLLLAFRALAFYLFGVVLFTKAMIFTKLSNVSFIRAIPMTAVLGFVLIKEKFTYKKAVLISVAFLGVVMISVKDFSHLFIWGKGEIFAVLSVLFMPLSNILRKRQSALLNNQEMTQILLFLASVILFTASLLTGEGLPTGNWNLNIMAVLIAAGISNTLIIFFLNYGFQKISAVFASNLLAVESLFAIIIGFIFFREFPYLKELLGGLIIIFSAYRMNILEAEGKP